MVSGPGAGIEPRAPQILILTVSLLTRRKSPSVALPVLPQSRMKRHRRLCGDSYHQPQVRNLAVDGPPVRNGVAEGRSRILRRDGQSEIGPPLAQAPLRRQGPPAGGVQATRARTRP